MAKAFITGAGWVTAAGMGSGRSGAPFSREGGAIARIARKSLFKEPDQRFGRLDDFSRLGLAGITLALRDAGLDEWSEKRPTGIICSTVNGCSDVDVKYFDTVIDGGGPLASPNLFAYTLPNSFLGEAAIRFGLTGPTIVLNGAPSSALAGLGIALDSLDSGECGAMVAGMCDLDAPSPYGGDDDTPAGSLFVVVEGRVREGCEAFGEVLRKENGLVLFDNREIVGYDDMLRSCLEKT